MSNAAVSIAILDTGRKEDMKAIMFSCDESLASTEGGSQPPVRLLLSKRACLYLVFLFLLALRFSLLSVMRWGMSVRISSSASKRTLFSVDAEYPAVLYPVSATSVTG